MCEPHILKLRHAASEPGAVYGHWWQFFFFLMNVYNRKACFQVISNDHLLIPDVQLVAMRQDILILCVTQRESEPERFFPGHSPSFGLASVRQASVGQAPLQGPLRQGREINSRISACSILWL